MSDVGRLGALGASPVPTASQTTLSDWLDTPRSGDRSGGQLGCYGRLEVTSGL